ncbi:hypothetical protein CSUI_009270 [Cystoisospora suis]|uniref:Uncharacterized protein n=1 Tax=Cystoisospora suis TaxID=483139 RepID=A0A2C6KH94_9APIC|nr:hypothetical protein CSUI_009270 [Cystoisospora suis]
MMLRGARQPPLRVTSPSAHGTSSLTPARTGYTHQGGPDTTKISLQAAGRPLRNNSNARSAAAPSLLFKYIFCFSLVSRSTSTVFIFVTPPASAPERLTTLHQKPRPSAMPPYAAFRFRSRDFHI